MKLNDVIIGQMSVNEKGHQLNKKQLSQLDKDQIEGRKPVTIRGKKGFVNGDGLWMSERYINSLKKQGKWQYQDVNDKSNRMRF